MVFIYFFIMWFLIYLIKGCGMIIMEVGWVVVLLVICGFMGGVFGGVLLDWLIWCGMYLLRVCKMLFVVGMVMVMLFVFVNGVLLNVVVIVLMMIVFFGKGFVVVGWVVFVDMVLEGMVGLSGGVFNGFGNIVGIVMLFVIGYFVVSIGLFVGVLWFVVVYGLIGIVVYVWFVGCFECICIVLVV